jgi:nucleoside-diphosphate kinase
VVATTIQPTLGKTGIESPQHVPFCFTNAAISSMHVGSYTLAIIKPDAFAGGKAGKIIALLEGAGFRIRAARVLRLTKEQAGEFYAVHRERPFYASLVTFMTSGPCMPMILEKPGAVMAFRETIGATDPAEAKAGTVRNLFAESKERNAIHGSDSDENAVREARFFFAESELCV